MIWLTWRQFRVSALTMFGVLGAVAAALALTGPRLYVVLGHAAFAFTLGAAAGLLIRRTVPAMAVTFAVVVAVQIVMPRMVRPHLATPARLDAVVTVGNLNGIDASGPGGTVRGLQVDIGEPGAWILTNETVDSAGRTVDTLPAWVAACMPPETPSAEIIRQQCLERLTADGYRQVVTYHPADRFWLFQAYETAIFGMLSLLLAGFCFMRIRPAVRLTDCTHVNTAPAISN